MNLNKTNNHIDVRWRNEIYVCCLFINRKPWQYINEKKIIRKRRKCFALIHLISYYFFLLVLVVIVVWLSIAFNLMISHECNNIIILIICFIVHQKSSHKKEIPGKQGKLLFRKLYIFDGIIFCSLNIYLTWKCLVVWGGRLGFFLILKRCFS